ncbi:160aa long hypothetical protein [Pyrococcus horikoshii OT3]|uniref:Uncharacterized protein n=1 Tax=Pyrococcus horikoshii (strain ATCC 700860 / DSM 12428 / JCM 9974 / NBRC 100139 / OT-3) TaxID=70601 RepID=O59313_PYRHO|nr:160aa long hypothetical protein [Pyrococcus horikoshii OT3]
MQVFSATILEIIAAVNPVTLDIEENMLSSSSYRKNSISPSSPFPTTFIIEKSLVSYLMRGSITLSVKSKFSGLKKPSSLRTLIFSRCPGQRSVHSSSLSEFIVSNMLLNPSLINASNSNFPILTFLTSESGSTFETFPFLITLAGLVYSSIRSLGDHVIL